MWSFRASILRFSSWIAADLVVELGLELLALLLGLLVLLEAALDVDESDRGLGPSGGGERRARPPAGSAGFSFEIPPVVEAGAAAGALARQHRARNWNRS